jgi:hypothetical protein
MKIRLRLDEVKPFPLQEDTYNKHDAQTGELAESIRLRGLLQEPIFGSFENDDNFYIIAGHRRIKALQILGVEDVSGEIKEYGDFDSAVLDFIDSNIQREKTNEQKAIEFIEAKKSIVRIKQKIENKEVSEPEKVYGEALVRILTDTNYHIDRALAIKLEISVYETQVYKAIFDDNYIDSKANKFKNVKDYQKIRDLSGQFHFEVKEEFYDNKLSLNQAHEKVKKFWADLEAEHLKKPAKPKRNNEKAEKPKRKPKPTKTLSWDKSRFKDFLSPKNEARKKHLFGVEKRNQCIWAHDTFAFLIDGVCYEVEEKSVLKLFKEIKDFHEAA